MWKTQVIIQKLVCYTTNQIKPISGKYLGLPSILSLGLELSVQECNTADPHSGCLYQYYPDDIHFTLIQYTVLNGSTFRYNVKMFDTNRASLWLPTRTQVIRHTARGLAKLIQCRNVILMKNQNDDKKRLILYSHYPKPPSPGTTSVCQFDGRMVKVKVLLTEL